MPIFIDTDEFNWLIVPGGPTAEDKKFLSHLTAISEPQSKFHGIKAIKILEYFDKNFDNIPLGAQIIAIQGFTNALRKKRDDKTFTNKRSNEVDKYFKYLKQKIARYEPPEAIPTPFSQAGIPITKISLGELRSKTGEEAYKCTICRLAFDTIDKATPPTEPTPKEMRRIKALADKSLKAAKSNSGPEEAKILQQIAPFATDLARLCVAPQDRPKTPKKEKKPAKAEDLEKVMDLKSLMAQIESYRCTEPILTECGHAFGTECLLQWINEQGNNVTCPYCRKRLSQKPATRDRSAWHDDLDFFYESDTELGAQAAAEMEAHLLAQTAGTPYEATAQAFIDAQNGPWNPQTFGPAQLHQVIQMINFVMPYGSPFSTHAGAVPAQMAHTT
jgi:hypothetical protein